MNYENYMKKCIALAKNGEGLTSPNPLVGCIVLDKNNNEISTSYHHKYGENHAERDALLKLHNGEEKDGTLVVNLEPCSHYGKTPPCADLIIERGLKKVIIGMQDVNPIVAGNGIRKLQKAGIEVISGVLENECKALNEIFIKNMTLNKTFIAIKTATTLDGKTATQSGSSKWITSKLAREEVKKIRTRYDAIMTSSTTILADNPTMLHRKKIILDRTLKTNLEAPIYKDGEIYLFNETLDMFEGGVNFIKTPVKEDKLDLEFVFEKAYELGIKSILIESGGHLAGSSLKYADKIYHFIAPKITGDNTSLSCFTFQKIDNINKSLNFKISDIQQFEPDILLTYYPIQ